MRATPTPATPVTTPASSAEKRATRSARLSKGLLAIQTQSASFLPEDAGVEPLPGLHLRREVAHPRLLVLAGGVEGEPLGDAALGGHRVQNVLALLDAAPVDHGEDRVGPVLVGGPLVAVGDRLVVGEHVADLVNAVFGHLPDA